MATLGHSARIVISTSSMSDSLKAWTAIGFEIEDESVKASRLTDGQILLTLLNESFASPAVAYFHADPSRLSTLDALAGVSVSDMTEQGCTVTLECGFTIYVHQRSGEVEERPTHEQNEVLGFIDALAIGVEDPITTRTTFESLGFFVQEEWGGQFPQSDVTDGLVVISLHGVGAKRFLTYSADHVAELADVLDESTGITVSVTESPDGTSASAILTMPEGTTILVSEDY